MTTKPKAPINTVYDIYTRNTKTGYDNYFTEFAMPKAFIEDGTYQAIVEGDGGKYFVDQHGVIVTLYGNRTIVLKPKGDYNG